MNKSINNEKKNKLLQQGVERLNLVWKIIGVTIIWLIALELLSNICLLIINPTPSSDFHLMKEACYKNAVWLDEYSKEHFASEQFNWKPIVYWRRKPYAGKYININDEGIRATWHKPLKQSNKERTIINIFVFGGSTIWGAISRDNYTIPSQISKLLSENNYNNIKVTNYGEDGYISTQEIITLILELQKGNIPDIVIFYDGFNDVFGAIQNGKAATPHNELKRVTSFDMISSNKHLQYQAFLSVVKGTATFRLIEYIKQKFPQKDDMVVYGSNELAIEVVETYITNVKTIEALGEQFKFKTLFYWQPVIFTKSNLTSYESLQVSKKDYLRNFHDKVYKLIDNSKTLTKDSNFHNLSNIFQSNKNTIYIDQCHITETANNMVAKEILKDLIPFIKDLNQSGNLK